MSSKFMFVNDNASTNDIAFVVLLAVCIGLIVCWLYPKMDDFYRKEIDHYVNYMTNNDIAHNKLDLNVCSKSCCSGQWPTSIMMPLDPRVKPGFVNTNLNCTGFNSGQHGVGCLCVSQDQFDYVANRGNNIKS